jgi:hypothetical protein
MYVPATVTLVSLIKALKLASVSDVCGELANACPVGVLESLSRPSFPTHAVLADAP